MGPLFTAVASSARQLLLLLRCISFSKKAQVRISAEGIRFTAEEGSVMEAFVFLEKALFTSYTYDPSTLQTSQDDTPDPPVFEVSLASLLETLNIFGSADLTASKRSNDYDSFAAYRLNRHAGINAFSSQAMGVNGICTLTYGGEGSPLSVHMSEAGVTTTCELVTYEADSVEDIPFDRDAVALKTIMRSATLLDATAELAALSPTELIIHASPKSRSGTSLSLVASGALGSVNVDFATATSSQDPVLETFQCVSKTSACFKFNLIKSAQRAMASATKVSLRLDEEGVLSLQFLIEVESENGGGQSIAFVDFRIVPLVEGEDDGDGESSLATDDENP